MTRFVNRKSLLLFCGLSLSLITQAQEPTESTEVLPVHDLSRCAPDGIALGGFDAVSYHINTKPIYGSNEFTTKYEKLTYQFSTQSNLEEFLNNPKQYLPAFGGWCATAIALGRLTCPDYTNYKIENGQLLLFETLAFFNGRHVWDGNPMKYFDNAESNFSELVNPSEQDDGETSATD